MPLHVARPPLTERMAAALLALGRPGLRPVVPARAWLRPIRVRRGRVMLAQPAGDALTDIELKALIAFALVRRTWRRVPGYAAVLLPLGVFALPSLRHQPGPGVLAVLGGFLTVLALYLNPQFVGWVAEPGFRAFLGGGGDARALAGALWKLHTVTWHAWPNLAALIEHGVRARLDALAALAGTTSQRLLQRVPLNRPVQSATGGWVPVAVWLACMLLWLISGLAVATAGEI